VHSTLRVALRHLLMHDATARGHPLNVAGAECAAIAKAVAVLNAAGKNVSDGLDAAVRVPRKTGAIILRLVVAEIVEEEERIGLLRIAKSEGTAQLYASAFDGGLRLHDAFNGADGHGNDARAVLLCCLLDTCASRPRKKAHL
jgi:hypothetical protein